MRVHSQAPYTSPDRERWTLPEMDRGKLVTLPSPTSGRRASVVVVDVFRLKADKGTNSKRWCENSESCAPHPRGTTLDCTTVSPRLEPIAVTTISSEV